MLQKKESSKMWKRGLGISLFLMMGTLAQAQTLKNVEAITMRDGAYQLRYHFDRTVSAPVHYFNEDKKMLVLDFKASGLANSVREKRINNDLLSNVRNIYAQNKLRSTVSLKNSADFTIRANNDMVIVDVTEKHRAANVANWDNSVASNQNYAATSATLNDVGFVRNSRGEGVVEIYLPNSSTDVSVREEGKKIRVALDGYTWDASQNRRIQVTDFATPVAALEVVNVRGQAYVDIITQAPYQYRAQQVGSNKYQLIVSPKRHKANNEQISGVQGADKKNYTGELITINFQDIDVRAVLQIIADFTGLNIVVSDKVNSRITIRLQNVPWDQALDTVLLYTGLGQAREGNIIFIAPQADLQAYEGVNLITEIIQINYADAPAVAEVLAKRINTSTTGDHIGAGLSRHGSINVDARTNMLIVQDTASQMKVIRDLVKILDRPVRQVQISAQIVAAFDDFSRDLGVKWGVDYKNNRRPTNNGELISGAPGTNNSGNLGIDLGVSGASTIFDYMILKRNVNINLEISAMQAEGRGETLSNPVVLTTDRQTAYIKQGTEIAYSTASDGGTNTEFKEVVMELNVTPQITPDNKIIMDLLITKDEPQFVGAGQEPAISKKELKTQALVSDGETIVLGGIYEHQVSNITSKVPFFGDLPLLGNLFKQQQNQNKKMELLIFVTPNIIDTLGY